MALNDHRQTVTHKNTVDTSLIKDSSPEVVIGCQHGQSAIRASRRAKEWHGDFLYGILHSDVCREEPGCGAKSPAGKLQKSSDFRSSDHGADNVIARLADRQSVSLTIGLVRVPIPEMLIETSSPCCSVKLSSGTIPVPVIRNAPSGRSFSRNSQPASSSGVRFI